MASLRFVTLGNAVDGIASIIQLEADNLMLVGWVCGYDGAILEAIMKDHHPMIENGMLGFPNFQGRPGFAIRDRFVDDDGHTRATRTWRWRVK